MASEGTLGWILMSWRLRVAISVVGSDSLLSGGLKQSHLKR